MTQVNEIIKKGPTRESISFGTSLWMASNEKMTSDIVLLTLVYHQMVPVEKKKQTIIKIYREYFQKKQADNKLKKIKHIRILFNS